MQLLCAIPEMIGRVVHGRESAIRPAGWTRNGSLPRPGISHIAGLVVPLLLSSPGVGLAQTVDTTLWVTNGPVSAIVADGSTIYIGGNFTHVGPAGGGAGVTRNNIAAIDAATGVATAWNPNADRPIYDIAVSGGTVYVGGAFSSIGGQPRRCIAALDAASGAATAWNPNPNAYVGALSVSGGSVYVCGGFTSIGGSPRNYIAKLSMASGFPTAWNPNPNGQVVTLAVSGGTVYAAGASFTSIGGQPRNNLAALDAASGAATAWNPNPNERVFALAVSGETVYVGGLFTSVFTYTRNYIAAVDAATGYPTAWNPGATVDPCTPEYCTIPFAALAVSGGRVYAGGGFSSIGGQPRTFFAAIITDDNLVSVGGDPSMEGSLTVAPNPTRAGMQIQYSVARPGRVRLELLDVSGRVEATLADRVQEPGRHVATWDGVGFRGRVSPGLHFIRLVAPDGVMVRKLAIIQ